MRYKGGVRRKSCPAALDDDGCNGLDREAAEGQMLGRGGTARESGKVFTCAAVQTVKPSDLSV